MNLSALGRRLERLMYFGLILLIVCVVNYVIGEAAAKISDAVRANAINAVVAKIKAHSSTVDLGLETIRRTKNSKDKQLQDIHERAKQSHIDFLTSMVKLWAPVLRMPDGLNGEILAILKESGELSATQVITQLEKLYSIRPKNVRVYEIEAPTIVEVTLASVPLKIPLELVALATHGVTLVALVIWLLSFSSTRHRELVMMMRENNVVRAFPHLLNQFIFVIWQLPRHKRTSQSLLHKYFPDIWTKLLPISVYSRGLPHNPVFWASSATFLRMLFIALLVVPPITIHFATSISLFSIVDNSELVLFAGAMAYVLIFVSSLSCIIGEANPKLRRLVFWL